MNYDDLIKKGFHKRPDGNWTKTKPNLPRSSSLIQKLEDDHKEKREALSNNTSEETKGDEKNIGIFQVSVAFFIRDLRKRDLDGMLSTIMDCLIHAGVLEDDNRFIVPKIDIRSYKCQRGHDRCEVKLERIA